MGTKGRRVNARCWEKQGPGSYCLMDTELQFGKMRVLEMDNRDGCPAMYVGFIPLNSEMIKMYCVYFPTINNNKSALEDIRSPQASFCTFSLSMQSAPLVSDSHFVLLASFFSHINAGWTSSLGVS